MFDKYYIQSFFKDLKQHYLIVLTLSICLVLAFTELIYLDIWTQDLNASKKHEKSTLLRFFSGNHDDTFYQFDFRSEMPYHLNDVINQLDDTNVEVMRYIKKELTLNSGLNQISKKVDFVDDNFLVRYPISINTGETRLEFSSKESCFISNNLALKLFKSDDVIGEKIKVNDTLELIVEGVFNNKSPYFFQFDLLCSISNYLTLDPIQNYNKLNTHVFLWIKEDFKFIPFKYEVNRTISRMIGDNPNYSLVKLQQRDYFTSNTDKHTLTDIKYLKILDYQLFLLICLVIISFMSLFLSINSLKIKEIAIRKSLGMSFFEFFFVKFILHSIIPIVSFFIALILSLFLFNDFQLMLMIEHSFEVPILKVITFIVLLSGVSLVYPIILFFRKDGDLLYGEKSVGLNGTVFKKIHLPLQYGFLCYTLVFMFTLNQYFDHVIENKKSFNNEHLITIKEGEEERKLELNTQKPNKELFEILNTSLIKNFKEAEFEHSDEKFNKILHKDRNLRLIVYLLLSFGLIIIVANIYINIRLSIKTKYIHNYIAESYGASYFDKYFIIIKEQILFVFISILLSWFVSFFPIRRWVNDFVDNPGLSFTNFAYPSLFLLISVMLISFLNLQNEKYPN